MAKNPQKKPSLLRSMIISLRAVPPLQRSIVVVGVCIASVFELVGFAAIIPLLSVMSPETDMELGGRREMIHNALENAYTTLGLPMNLPTLLLTILLFMVIKAVISIAVTRYVASVMTRINTEARLDVIRTLMQARWSFYARQRLSRLVSAAGESSNAVGEAFQLSTDMLTAFLRIAIYLLICYVIAPVMVLVAAGVAGIMAVSYGALVRQSKRAAKSKPPVLLHQEPDLAIRVIREEFNKEYRGVVIDDPALYEEVLRYVEAITPELADRVELYDEDLPIFERFHVHEQLHKALDRKVWLPSGGSIIIERTEALTVIDVNTAKNVGRSNLEETVFANNLEAAEEVARQLRLRDIGGIIVIDFIDMEIRKNREEVVRKFKEALARDKTRTQVFEISELGLVEMTRKRISEGLVEAFSTTCPSCEGRGIILDHSLL